MKQVDGKRAVLENGVLRKEVKFGFSWGAFFLGFIYPLIKEDYMVAGISFAILSLLFSEELFLSSKRIPFILRICASSSVNGCHPCLISLLTYILLYRKPNTIGRTNINGKNIILATPITAKEIPATI